MEFGRVDDLVAEEEQVEVERSLAPADGPDSAGVGFDLLESVEEGKRGERRLDCSGGVQKGALAGGPSGGFCLVVGADPAQGRIREVSQS